VVALDRGLEAIHGLVIRPTMPPRCSPAHRLWDTSPARARRACGRRRAPRNRSGTRPAPVPWRRRGCARSRRPVVAVAAHHDHLIALRGELACGGQTTPRAGSCDDYVRGMPYSLSPSLGCRTRALLAYDDRRSVCPRPGVGSWKRSPNTRPHERSRATGARGHSASETNVALTRINLSVSLAVCCGLAKPSRNVASQWISTISCSVRRE